jgi:integrase/recombinase XerD
VPDDRYNPCFSLIPVAPVFTNTERLALTGSLAGYSGLTREAYELDLRQYASWYHQHHVRLFQACRADIECFARELEARGRARATITRRLCTVAGFCRYAVEEDLLDHSPAAHVRRPRLDYESHATGLDRNELGALLVAAGLGSSSEHALISLLALNGLRASEATGANIENLGVERGHRTLVITTGSEATGPASSGWARSTAISVRQSPPRASATTRSATIFPGSCTARGARHRASPADSPRPRPVTRAASSSSSTPAWDTSPWPSADTVILGGARYCSPEKCLRLGADRTFDKPYPPRSKQCR